MKFISHKVALELFKIGFDEECWAWFNLDHETILNCYSENLPPKTPSLEAQKYSMHNRSLKNICLPTYDQVTEWFRLKHNFLFVPCNDYYQRNAEPPVIEYYFKMKNIRNVKLDVEPIKSSDYYYAFNAAILIAANWLAAKHTNPENLI